MARIANKRPSADGVQFVFVNGTKLDCNVGDLPQEMIERLAVHGIAQKVGDSYASAESVEEALGNAKSVWENLKAGQWATKAARGGKYVEALHRVTGKPYEDCLEAWQGMTDKQKADLRKHPGIKKAIADIEVENAARLAEQTEGEDAVELSTLF